MVIGNVIRPSQALTKRSDIVCQTLKMCYSRKVFNRLVMRQNIARPAFKRFKKTLRNKYCLFLLAKQCFATWPDVQKLLDNKLLMFDKQCLIVWPGPYSKTSLETHSLESSFCLVHVICICSYFVILGPVQTLNHCSSKIEICLWSKSFTLLATS